MGSQEAQGRLWGVEPDGWASHELNHSPLFRAMMEATNIGPGTNVLDIGCGAGHSSELIKTAGASVVGVDAAQGMVDYASKAFDGIDFQVGGIEDLAFDDDQFDVIFAANSVQYAADLTTALRELRRVCKPGGSIVAGLFGPPEGVSYKPVLGALGPFMPKPPPGAKPGGPFRLSAPGVLEEGFRTAGIDVTALAMSTARSSTPVGMTSGVARGLLARRRWPSVSLGCSLSKRPLATPSNRSQPRTAASPSTQMCTSTSSGQLDHVSATRSGTEVTVTRDSRAAELELYMSPEIDLLSIASFVGSQPHDQFAWLRDHSPVHFHPEPAGAGFWAITRYDDVRTVGRDHETFSSTPTIMIQDPSGSSSALGGDSQMMLMTDPPVHTRMRRLVNREFTPRAAAALRPRLAELATQIVDQVTAAGRCDLVTDLAGEMPSFAIADLLGIPLEDGRRLYHYTEALHASDEVMSNDQRSAAIGEMYLYAQQVYATKTADPQDDLATLLVNGVIDDRPVDETDFFLWFLLLVDAGGDTTRNLLGAGMYALLEHPDQLALLRSDPDTYLPSAIEELLRWVSPVIYMRRTATVDAEIAGQAISAGDKVVMYYGAANRDRAVFADADTFDITRNPNPHVAFGGGGPHYCLGAHLARLEIEALLREMLERLEDLELDGEPTWLGSNFVFGPTSMPVQFTSV